MGCRWRASRFLSKRPAHGRGGSRICARSLADLRDLVCIFAVGWSLWGAAGDRAGGGDRYADFGAVPERPWCADGMVSAVQQPRRRDGQDGLYVADGAIIWWRVLVFPAAVYGVAQFVDDWIFIAKNSRQSPPTSIPPQSSSR